MCCSSRKELDGLEDIDPSLIMRRSTYGELKLMSYANSFQIPPELVNPYELKVKRDFVSLSNPELTSNQDLDRP